MDVLKDLGLYIVRSLGYLAQWLSSITSPIPWPIVAGIAAIPLLFVASILVWFLRGAIWPVRCKHPATTVRTNGDKACRVWVAGEWNYCKHHNKRVINSRNQEVDPKLPRWQTMVAGKPVDRTDIRGTNSNVSLLFYRGFARKPSQVIQAFPETISEKWTGFTLFIKKLRKEPLQEVIPTTTFDPQPNTFEREKYLGFSERAKRADQALLLLKWSLPIAFVITASASFLKGSWTVPLEYLALFSIWIVIEIFRKGILQDSKGMDWRLQALKETVYGFGVVIGLAIITLLLNDYIFPFAERMLAQ